MFDNLCLNFLVTIQSKHFIDISRMFDNLCLNFLVTLQSKHLKKDVLSLF
jgi:hypothetical protein